MAAVTHCCTHGGKATQAQGPSVPGIRCPKWVCRAGGPRRESVFLAFSSSRRPSVCSGQWSLLPPSKPGSHLQIFLKARVTSSDLSESRVASSDLSESRVASSDLSESRVASSDLSEACLRSHLSLSGLPASLSLLLRLLGGTGSQVWHPGFSWLCAGP